MKLTSQSLFTLSLLFLFNSLISTSSYATEQPIDQTKQIFVVRHAEKLNQGNNPGLSEIGKRRAAALANKLIDIKISTLIATQYLRTQSTLEKVADSKNLTVTIVPAKSPIKAHINQTVTLALQSKGNVVIAGHSNTVPLILEALGTRIKINIDEAQYGDLYILQMFNNKLEGITHSHYGE